MGRFGSRGETPAERLWHFYTPTAVQLKGNRTTAGEQLYYSRRVKVPQSACKSPTVATAFCGKNPRFLQPTQNQKDREAAPESHISDKSKKVFVEAIVEAVFLVKFS